MTALARLAFTLAAAFAGGAHAATFVVADHDAAGLVRAIAQAEATPEPDRIELAPHGLYLMRDAADDERKFALPLVRGALTIAGNGAEIRRYSDAGFALVGIARGGKLALENLALAEAAHGAIVNRGVLHVDRVRITDSTADGANAIVVNYGTLRGVDSEISHNAVLAASRDAGIVLNYGRIDLARTRLSGNTVTGRRAALTASALLNLGDAELSDVTIEGNSARAEPDDMRYAYAVVNVGNGALRSDGVRLVDNLPEQANALPAPDTDAP
ncbi:MAG TPA: hypothetical protein VJ724_14490 [Tahibacter sp.]|nr:hypothetical protein [Tahibacter sp.]